ncbi:tRNA epoxyqueuosine(34) reductase QueG [uncultured Hydrogenophaga sp.]|uniref:tRNA epoxyqueuosine(34) reductase QueG n=1 Tax=uncultured Hydrogenophaga sp. TaxID=199683 RepID=UPI00259073FB|nr:tRNA epoxyqueuosine(34) reductase QueG [uncultured Hydrogenophaga sp.]
MRAWGRQLGFSQIGVAGVDLRAAEPGLMAWLSAGCHGDMAYMAAHGLKRARPAELVPGTLSVITARMDYLPRDTPANWVDQEWARLQRPGEAIVSVYARGRDYHKVLRARLQQLSDRIAEAIGPFGHRVFTDSAPVLEVELASRSGIGWRGKHTLTLHREAGSMFFLGEIYVDLALPPSAPVSDHCGSCSACIDVCPTQAITGPQRVDARRCISYLTIEHAGPIPVELRPAMANRIYGCDDCQLVCPWNKFAQRATLPDFDARQGMSGATLVELFAWSEAEFLRRTEGSAIRRIGHERWLRNLAVGLGNALRATGDGAVRQALQARADDPSELVREHVAWALAQG